ncbi:hypothetical protein LPA44_17475 [Halobacterium sp. KA-4]|uniref:DUF6788 family protein n=1 Tax=Halobacterium sp. KA-4 TaxID=2896367 RepID=UPI001E2C3BB4|nr:DUF6788 family protein [Halobacterium sp. KA-4]MCD2201655.1 hypothetical protein [Halobacterium sp. KA-4]
MVPLTIHECWELLRFKLDGVHPQLKGEQFQRDRRAEGESIEAVEESSGGTVVIKKVSCGKDNCKCQSGELHGPYKYIVRRQGDSLDWEYKGPVSE